jgi:peroxiredoxin
MEIFLLLNIIVLWIVVLLLLILAVQLSRRSKITNQMFSPPETLPIGKLAPDYHAFTLTGKPVTRAAFSGRAILYVFIRPGCEPCHLAIPGIKELSPLLRLAATELVLVSDMPADATRDFVAKSDIDLPVLISEPIHSDLFQQYNPSLPTPFYCYVSAEGIVESSGFLGTPEWVKFVQRFKQ